jgi:hypothetical protein
MRTSRMVILTGLILAAVTSICWGRSIIEKKMYYLNAVTNKAGEAKYWFVYLGQHDCTLNRKYPGEEMQQVNGNMNLSLLSSGYIEGSGYSAKGKIDCVPAMILKNDKGERAIIIDSIDCIFEFGQKVRMRDGEIGDFIIDIEGQKKIASRFILTEYRMVSSDGERELKKIADDVPIAAIAFSKESIVRAMKGILPSSPTADTTKPPVK